MVTSQAAQREIVVEDYLDMVRLTGDIGAAFRATGRSFDGFKRTLRAVGQDQAADDLAKWHEADKERLRYALGEQWQQEKTEAGWR